MKRGPKPGSVYPTSTTAKMLSLAVGEMIWIEQEIQDAKPTRLERDVQTRMIRSPALAGRHFTTTRLYAVAHEPTRAILLVGITRTK